MSTEAISALHEWKPWTRIVGLGGVVAVHAVAAWGMWHHAMAPVAASPAPLFVNWIAPPAPKPQAAPAAPRKVKLTPESKPLPQEQLVAQAPVQSAHEPVAVAAPPRIEAPAIAVPARPAQALNLADELAVSCPERPSPAYPALSRRLGETGKVVLRVELDERGAVSEVHVAHGSGAVRLDEAAVAAVKTWRCNPAQREGRAVRAVALQPFRFALEGR